MKRRNIYNDLTDRGRELIDVGEVLTFETENGRQSWKVVKKAPKQVIIVETKLLTMQELDEMGKKV